MIRMILLGLYRRLRRRAQHNRPTSQIQVCDEGSRLMIRNTYAWNTADWANGVHVPCCVTQLVLAEVYVSSMSQLSRTQAAILQNFSFLLVLTYQFTFGALYMSNLVWYPQIMWTPCETVCYTGHWQKWACENFKFSVGQNTHRNGHT